MSATVVLSAYVHVEQLLFRRRTEQLLTDVRSLTLVKASADDGRRVVQKWSFRQDTPNEKCTPQDCDYSFRHDNLTARLLARFSFSEERQMTVARTLTWLGGRPAAAFAHVGIRSGMVQFGDFSIWISTPDNGDQAFLVGSVGKTWPRYTNSNWDRPSDVLDRSLRHPNYLVGRRIAHLNADTFGQFRAAIIWAEFSSTADASEVDRLTQLDLGCLTRFRSCRETDLMPSAWAHLVADEGNYHLTPTCTTELVKHVARLADVIAVVQMQSPELETPKQQNWPSHLPGIRLIRILKGPEFASRGFQSAVEVDNAEMTRTEDGGLPVRAGEQYIFLLQNHSYGSNDAIALYPCGILSLNQANITTVQKSADIPSQ